MAKKCKNKLTGRLFIYEERDQQNPLAWHAKDSEYRVTSLNNTDATYVDKDRFEEIFIIQD